jgi:hypothetical protein
MLPQLPVALRLRLRLRLLPRLPLLLRLLLALPAWPAAALAADAAAGCQRQSTARVPLLVELYTSEGCSSCPPADRWLSGLKGRTDVVAMSFHVDYWDRLGWRDRFAHPDYTQRQAELMRSSGARYVYTPQVVVNGRDLPGWRSLPLPTADARPVALVQAMLRRDGEHWTAELQPLPGAPARIAGFWALTEDGHASQVKAGENRGATLGHDFVVRDYQRIGAWDASARGPKTLHYQAPGPRDAAHARHLNLVLTDADNGRVLQALKLGC